MNGRPCPYDWDVMEFENDNRIAFRCSECKVAYFSGPSHQELMEIFTEGVDEQ